MSTSGATVRVYRFRIYSLLAGAFALVVLLGLLFGLLSLFDAIDYTAQCQGFI